MQFQDKEEIAYHSAISSKSAKWRPYFSGENSMITVSQGTTPGFHPGLESPLLAQAEQIKISAMLGSPFTKKDKINKAFCDVDILQLD